ncbi:MAG TPA: ABC transporter ATP-binding protein [Thermoanaerobaculia bacterium]|nr:ABC transporter ATP-binding protein [Thermoanaerobaculia bacterium]
MAPGAPGDSTTGAAAEPAAAAVAGGPGEHAGSGDPGDPGESAESTGSGNRQPEPARLLTVHELRKSFTLGGRELPVLRGVGFRLAAGETLAIIGPSGSGKSTLLHILGTLERPTGGTVTLAGRDLYTLPERVLARLRNERIGFVFQDHYLLPQYSVLENVLLPALAFQRRWGSARPRAEELLARVGLADRLRHRPAELSGGERQRAAIARALLHRPALLLCDEPTGSLDHATAEAATELLFELQRQEGTMLVIATHSRPLAARCARRLELRDGLCFAA